jgi:hypothetical protein
MNLKNNEIMYVMPTPKVEIANRKFKFVGKAIPVNVSGDILDYLHAAGAYNSQLDVNNGSVKFDNYPSLCDLFSRKDLEEVDDVLSAIDEPRLKRDLENKGYAILMTKRNDRRFKYDDNPKGYIIGLDRVIQDLANQRLSKELKLNFGLRHFTTQESVELMNSDENYRKLMCNFWQHNSEVIQSVVMPISKIKKNNKSNAVILDKKILPTKVSSVRSYWGLYETHSKQLNSGPITCADSPLTWGNNGIFLVKRMKLES